MADSANKVKKKAWANTPSEWISDAYSSDTPTGSFNQMSRQTRKVDPEEAIAKTGKYQK